MTDGPAGSGPVDDVPDAVGPDVEGPAAVSPEAVAAVAAGAAAGESAQRESASLSAERSSTRLTAVRERAEAARRVERRARIAIAPRLRRRARRQRAAIRLAGAAALIVTVALLVAVLVLTATREDVQSRVDADADVREAATSSVMLMLTPDPAHANDYPNRVLAVTTGQQRQRIAAAATELAGYANALRAPATAQIVSAGVVSIDADSARVLLVAQASDPQLVGADSTSNGGTAADTSGSRVTVLVDLARIDGRWLIAATEVPQ